MISLGREDFLKRFKSFDELDSKEFDRKWEALQGNRSVNERVLGEVVCLSDFGAWIDIGEMFPALLKVDQMAGLSGENFKAYADNEFLPVGSKLTLKILSFIEPGRQIRVTNKL